ncbi:hypothetical protein VULLAG_LOCUS5910 [Vulpes lagopus]
MDLTRTGHRLRSSDAGWRRSSPRGVREAAPEALGSTRQLKSSARTPSPQRELRHPAREAGASPGEDPTRERRYKPSPGAGASRRRPSVQDSEGRQFRSPEAQSTPRPEVSARAAGVMQA